MSPRHHPLRLGALGLVLACSPQPTAPTDTPPPAPIATNPAPPVAAPTPPPTPPVPTPPPTPPVATPAPAASADPDSLAIVPTTPPSADPLASDSTPRPGIAILESERKTGPPKGLEPDIIRRIIKTRVDRVAACYNAGLQRDPDLRGRVAVEFEIDMAGKATVKKTSSDLKNGAAVEQCIAKIFKTLTFPRPTQRVVVTYPFVLEPG